MAPSVIRLFTRRSATSGWAQASWLGWPTLSCGGGGQIKTAGVNHHERELRGVAARAGRLVMAELRVETRGRYTGAVRVHVEGTELGSIPHSLTADFRAVVNRLHEAGDRATCRAELDAEPGGGVDVWLAARPHERAGDEPFLPPLSGARVAVPDEELRRLEEALGTRAKSKRVVRRGELVPRGRSWAVLAEGREFGTLPERHYIRLEQARDARFPLSCRVRIIRQPDGPLRVHADFPSS
jgi:hypothetical protein